MPNNASSHVIKHEIYSSSAYTDEGLVALVRERGPAASDALTTLLQRYRTVIYRACLSYLRDPALAEDASQEVLIRVYRGIDRFRGRSSFQTWLYRIVRNQCYTVASSRKRHSVCDSLDDAAHEISPVDVPDITDTVERRISINTALQSLSPSDRKIIRLRFFNGLDLNLIARKLDMSLSGAKMRLYRAIAKFRVAYSDLDVETPALAADSK